MFGQRRQQAVLDRSDFEARRLLGERADVDLVEPQIRKPGRLNRRDLTCVACRADLTNLGLLSLGMDERRCTTRCKSVAIASVAVPYLALA